MMADVESCAEAILRRLTAEGVRYLFGVAGGPLLPLYEALADQSGIVPVLAKHEAGAAFMAEGYAQVSGELAVACGTTGPGATNALTAVASANSDYVPVLFLSGQVATDAVGRGGLQDSSGGNWSLDLVDIFRSGTKLSTTISNAARLPGLLDHAIRTARSGLPGAVHLNIPADILTQTVAPLSRSGTTVPKTAPDPHAIAELAALAAGARAPVLLAGQGAKASAAGDTLVAVADRFGIPVATTLKGKGVFPEEHPLSLGVFGFGGNATACAFVCSDAIDLLIVIGSGLGEFATFGWDQRMAGGRGVCQIDLNPHVIGRTFPVDIAIPADADAALRALLAAVADWPPDWPHNGGEGRREVAARACVRDRPSAKELQSDHELLQASAVVARMGETLPEDAILFVDNGNCMSWVGGFYPASAARQIHVSMNVASMGYAVAGVIGGKLAAPDKPVVAVVGDGAFAMNGTEVHTAAELSVPVIWVVLNNSGHAMVGNIQEMIYGRTQSAHYRQPIDIAAVADGLGADSLRVHTLDEFDTALNTALSATAPFVIDARVDFNEVPWALRSRTATLHDAFSTNA